MSKKSEYKNQKNADGLIIDTGCANISSLKFALERLGYKIAVSSDIEDIKAAKKVFLPGVGSAEFAMKGILDRSLAEVIVSLEQPVLGICLGMQLMTNHSVENDVDTTCLGLIDTNIAKIEGQNKSSSEGKSEGKNLRLPHMGWNTLHNITPSPLFRDLTDKDYFYFVHTYCAPKSDYSLALCRYGQEFSASINQGNFYGVQFHPERSGKAGATLLKNFMEYCL
ncbi:imidazole glycerol phosphate synthase subunit HisH [Thalassotalea crassostreae]|uniref:imidazole glycerol phosphate synthase subunit HisH n=1 Tax=Thalassotalea crassostreae TaxID=1763536 RepID=UPI000838C376|nr:imidazole glycerol phosphate synthase subunit HisH [Thalassotalea crassostreae]